MKSMKRVLRVFAIVCAVALAYQVARAWSDNGHTLINRVAAEKVPASMPQFLKNAASTIEYLGPEPDRWRNTTEMTLKNAQEPDHFLDMERIADIENGKEGDDRRLLDQRGSALCIHWYGHVQPLGVAVRRHGLVLACLGYHVGNDKVVGIYKTFRTRNIYAHREGNGFDQGLHELSQRHIDGEVGRGESHSTSRRSSVFPCR